MVILIPRVDTRGRVGVFPPKPEGNSGDHLTSTATSKVYLHIFSFARRVLGRGPIETLHLQISHKTQGLGSCRDHMRSTVLRGSHSAVDTIYRCQSVQAAHLQDGDGECWRRTSRQPKAEVLPRVKGESQLKPGFGEVSKWRRLFYWGGTPPRPGFDCASLSNMAVDNDCLTRARHRANWGHH